MGDDDDIVSFEDAKRPHTFRRKDSKVRALRKAFKALTDSSLAAKKAEARKAKNARKSRTKPRKP